jgi:chromatin structure-remodeling complex subunit RSC1/2
MFFTKYTRGRPKPPAWTLNIPLFVCEYRYKDDVRIFKKIKSWTSCIPEQIRQHEYDFEPYADNHVDTLPKVKSPFVRGVVGTGGLDTNNYDFTQEGVPTNVIEQTQPTIEQPQMDLDVQAIREPVQTFENLETPVVAAVGGNSSLGASIDPALANFDASLLAAPSPAFLTPSTPTAAELNTTDFFTPLPSALSESRLFIVSHSAH